MKVREISIFTAQRGRINLCEFGLNSLSSRPKLRGVVKTFQRGESQVWISLLLTWVGLSRFLPCVSAGSYSRGEMELIKKKLIKIYAEKIPRIHAFSPPELKRLLVIDKKKGGGVTVMLRSHPSTSRAPEVSPGLYGLNVS